MVKRLRNSAKIALEAILSAIISEHNFRLQWYLGSLVFWFMAFFDFALWQDAILLLLVFLVLSLELLNSAVENLCDFSGNEFNVHKKMAKDFAAASVLLASFMAAFMFCIFVANEAQNFNYIPLNPTFLMLTFVSFLSGLIASLITSSKASLCFVLIFGINQVVFGVMALRPQWIVLSLFMALLWMIAEIRAGLMAKGNVA